MKILVTGSEGLIGKELVRQLRGLGHDVIGFDLKTVQSILNLNHLVEFFSSWWKPQVVFHLAAVVGPESVIQDPLKTIEVNISGTLNVAAVCSRYGVERLIFTSSSEVYGGVFGYESGMEEDQPPIIESPTHPRSCYPISKLAGESIILNTPGGMVARIFNTTGPGQSNQYVIPNMVKRALVGDPIQVYRDGLQTRCFCHVKDTVRGLIALMEYGEGGIWNIGSEKEITILELAEKVRELVSPVPIEFNPVLPEIVKYRRRPDLTKIKSLGWEAELSLNQIILDVREYLDK